MMVYMIPQFEPAGAREAAKLKEMTKSDERRAQVAEPVLLDGLLCPQERLAALGGVPDEVNIASFLPEGAERHPEASAVVSPGPGGAGWEILSYGALERRSTTSSGTAAAPHRFAAVGRLIGGVAHRLPWRLAREGSADGLEAPCAESTTE